MATSNISFKMMLNEFRKGRYEVFDVHKLQWGYQQTKEKNEREKV